MFYGDGLVPAVVRWLLLPRVGLPSSGERGAEHWETHQVFEVGCELVWKHIFALFIYIFIY